MTDYTCDEAREELPWVVGGGAAPEQLRRVALHLARCAACRGEIAAEVALRDSLRAAESALSAPSAAAWERLARRRRHWLPALLEVTGTPLVAVRVLDGALTTGAARPVLDWLRPWVSLGRAAS